MPRAEAATPLATFTVDRTDPAHPVNAFAWVVPSGVKQVTFSGCAGAEGKRRSVPIWVAPSAG